MASCAHPIQSSLLPTYLHTYLPSRYSSRYPRFSLSQNLRESTQLAAPSSPFFTSRLLSFLLGRSVGRSEESKSQLSSCFCCEIWCEWVSEYLTPAADLLFFPSIFFCLASFSFGDGFSYGGCCCSCCSWFFGMFMKVM